MFTVYVPARAPSPDAPLELLWTEVLTRAGLTDPADPAGVFRQVAVDDRRVLGMVSWRPCCPCCARQRWPPVT